MLEQRRQLTALCYDGNRRFRTKTPPFRDIFHTVSVMRATDGLKRTGVSSSPFFAVPLQSTPVVVDRQRVGVGREC